jgi:hypothetical protein
VQAFSDVNRNEGIKNLCSRIDAQIHAGYELQTFNYIASDELRGDGKFASDYTASDLEKWKEHINQQLQFPDVSQNELLPALLAMYEAPVGLKS